MALVFAVGLMRWWGEDPRRWLDVGRWRSELGRLGMWVCVGLIMVGVVVAVQWVLGVRGWGDGLGWKFGQGQWGRG